MNNFDLKKFLVENKVTYNSRLVESDFDVEPYDGDDDKEEKVLNVGDKIDNNMVNKPITQSGFMPVSILKIDPSKKQIELELNNKQKQITTFEILRSLVKPEFKIKGFDDK